MPVDRLMQGYIAKEETFPDGATIIEEGSKGDWVYLILEGRAKVKKRTAKGFVILDALGKGDIFGEMVLLETGRGKRCATVIAADGPIHVGILDSERLLKDYDMLSPQLKGLIRSLTIRLKEATEKICAIVVESR